MNQDYVPIQNTKVSITRTKSGFNINASFEMLPGHTGNIFEDSQRSCVRLAEAIAAEAQEIVKEATR